MDKAIEELTAYKRTGRSAAPSRLRQRVPFTPLSFLASMLALVYAFPWLRVPDLLGVAVPLQRIIPWLGLVSLFFDICARRKLHANRLTTVYLTCCGLLLCTAGLSTFVNLSTSDIFNPLLNVVELSKYLAVFTAGYLVYYTLRRGHLTIERLTRLLVLSGAASILLSYVFLALYWTGFRTDNEILAPTFGRALGVWPTGGFLPRLAGTGAEPQQLSVLFLTPLLVMLNRQHIRRYWLLALLGVLALVLSQSKFSLVSLAAVALYLDLIYRKHRLVLVSFMLVAVPLGALSLTHLPTFSSTLEQGLEAKAFTERFDNLNLLNNIIQTHPLLGIGIGQYGTYRGELVFGDPSLSPSYKANSDLLSIFAEMGVAGFVIALSLLLLLLGRFSLRALSLRGAERELFYPYWIGAVTIFFNMFIGYEFLHTFFWINVGALLYFEHSYQQRLRT